MRILIADGIDTAAEQSGVTVQAARTLSRLTGASAEWVDWPAAMVGVGGSGSWVENAAQGLGDLRRRISLDDGGLILISYSGGNRIVHDLLNQAATSGDAALLARVRAVGFVSDPWRPRGEFVPDTVDPGGWGLCGEDHGPIPERSVWCAAEGDAATAAEPDAMLRTAADIGTNMDEKRLRGAFEGVRRHLSEESFQLQGLYDGNPVRWLRELFDRGLQLRGDVDRYYGGWHTEHYTRPYAHGHSLVERMCARLAELSGEPGNGSEPEAGGEARGISPRTAASS
ncbi:hypothetical protein [Dietzia sp.]|uniref:hypothetical protein n=1 Tax=Dietzia sp. TaxID=1871616 RepID=UPI002FDA32C5